MVAERRGHELRPRTWSGDVEAGPDGPTTPRGTRHGVLHVARSCVEHVPMRQCGEMEAQWATGRPLP